MGLCFRKSISLCKGVRLNLSKSGPSLSLGVRGLRKSVSLNGRTRTTVGVPGTGIYYTKTGNLKNSGSYGGSRSYASGSASGTSCTAAASVFSGTASGDTASSAAAAVKQYEEKVEELKTIHRQSDGKIDWEQVRADGTGNLAPFAQRILDGDVDSYFKVIKEAGPFDDLLEYGSQFDIGTDGAGCLEVEFKVRSDEAVPKNKLSLSSNGGLIVKEMPKTQYYDLVRDYVSSTILRVARDSFALLPVKTVVIHAVDSVVNTATGNDEEIVLVSVRIQREQLENINFDRIDPSDCLTSMECNENFRKTLGYAPVKRILPV